MRIETNALPALQPVAPVARIQTASPQEVQAAAETTRAGGQAAGAESASVETKLAKLGDELQSFDISLRFRRDEENGAVVIDLFDQSTGEKVRQIPTEAALHLSKVLGSLKGVVLDLQA